MRVACIYNYPSKQFGPEHATYAQRFVDSYVKYPPLFNHIMCVVSNGGPPAGLAVAQFSWIPNTRFLTRDNVGMDIGAYQFAAQSIPCDLMVFFGGSSYIRGPGWLQRMTNAYQCYGDALYGCTGNQGDNRRTTNGWEIVWPHVRTTAFWCEPHLINEHPYRIKDNNMRYPYEHGADGLTTWVLQKGLRAWIVGWDCIKPLMECDSMPGGFHNGDQHNIIVGDRLCAPPYYHVP
jgi:hypothetical protein